MVMLFWWDLMTRSNPKSRNTDYIHRHCNPPRNGANRYNTRPHTHIVRVHLVWLYCVRCRLSKWNSTTEKDDTNKQNHKKQSLEYCQHCINNCFCFTTMVCPKTKYNWISFRECVCEWCIFHHINITSVCICASSTCFSGHIYSKNNQNIQHHVAGNCRPPKQIHAIYTRILLYIRRRRSRTQRTKKKTHHPYKCFRCVCVSPSY